MPQGDDDLMIVNEDTWTAKESTVICNDHKEDCNGDDGRPDDKRCSKDFYYEVEDLIEDAADPKRTRKRTQVEMKMMTIPTVGMRAIVRVMITSNVSWNLIMRLKT